MSFFKKGPEIKLSEIKVPEPVQDVYYDLKERHLLPLAAILLLAIVVAPFALGSSSSPEHNAGGATATGATATESTAATSGELVAKSAPGLRDYKRRLNHLTSKNPFRQQYRRGESASAGGGESSGGGAAAGEESSTIESSTGEGGGSEGGRGSETNAGFSAHPHLTYFSYAIDVKVSTGGAEGSAAGAGHSSTTDKHVQVRKNLPELTMLPNREAPAIMYMGSTKDGKKALMLISSSVSSIFGDATCVLGSETCELIALEKGLPETFVYGASDRTFKVELLEIHLVESKQLHKAPLGKPHKHPEG